MTDNVGTVMLHLRIIVTSSRVFSIIHRRINEQRRCQQKPLMAMNATMILSKLLSLEQKVDEPHTKSDMAKPTSFGTVK